MKRCKYAIAAGILLTAATLCIVNAQDAPQAVLKPISFGDPRTPIRQEDIPLTIKQPGSYYLAGNITAAGTAINVDADDVSIDLCGFQIKGPGTGKCCGILMGSRSNVEIQNGTIRGFYQGIYEVRDTGKNHRVINVRAVFNKNSGIYLSGHNHLIKDCTVSDNGTACTEAAFGIRAGRGCAITGNVLFNNGYNCASEVHAVNAGFGSTVTGNTVRSNGTSAAGQVYGISAGKSCTVSGNTVDFNGTSATGASVIGITAEEWTTVLGNTASNNGSQATGTTIKGIHLGGNNFVSHNTACNNSGTKGGENLHKRANCTYGLNHAP
jgi:hypothetical protein